MITEKQKKVLNFITSYTTKHSVSPSLTEICKHCKMASVSTAHYHINKLYSAGILEKQNHKSRSLSVNKTETLLNIPIMGIISAGQPIEAIQNTETIAVAKSKIPDKCTVFALKVSGDSMKDENINNGDIILVKKQNYAANGDKVVALLGGYEVTLKKYYKEKKTIRLQPANSNYSPIIIKRNDSLSIQGIVIDLIKNCQVSEDLELLNPIHKTSPVPLNKIILGDVIEELRKLPDNSFDLVIIDPPYNIGKDFGNNNDKMEMKDYIDWCKKWFRECMRTMKPTGTLFIYGYSEILAHLSVEINYEKRWLIWHYTNKNVASLNFWQRSHESILCVWKTNPIFNRDAVREPYTEGFLNGAAGKIRKGTNGRFSKHGKETIYNAHENGALPRDVIKVPALAGGAGMVERWFLCKTCGNAYEPRLLKNHVNHEVIKHPTQKPMELTRKLIKSCKPEENGSILIPFAGSGSECAVAKELGLSYVGIEINPIYIKIAEKMISQTKKDCVLF